MKKIILLLMAAMGLAAFSFQPALADPSLMTKVDNCNTNKGSAFNPTQNCLTTLPAVKANENTLKTGLQIVFGVATGVALITLGIAAFNFATIATDAEKIGRSKRAIEFALVGLAISLLAEAIVTVVIGKL